MSTLQDNFKVLLQILNGKINKKVEQKDIDEANDKIKKSVDTTVKGVKTLVNAQLSEINRDLNNKLEIDDFKTINGQTLVKGTSSPSNYAGIEEPNDINFHFAKTSSVDNSAQLKQVNSNNAELQYYYPVSITQTEMNEHIQYLKDNQSEESPYYVSYVNDKVRYTSSSNGKITMSLANKTNDLLILKIDLTIPTYHPSGSSYYQNDSTNYENTNERWQVAWTDFSFEDAIGWNQLENTVYQKDGSPPILLRRLVYYKYATQENETLTIKANNFTTYNSTVIVPQFRAVVRSISNVEGFEYISTDAYERFRANYQLGQGQDYNKRILPIPPIGNNDLALLCFSNEYFRNSSWNYKYGQQYFQGPFWASSNDYGLLPTDDRAGFTEGIATDPDYIVASCFILKGCKFQDHRLHVKYGSLLDLYYSQVHSNYDIGSIDVDEKVICKKKSLQYNGSEILNKTEGINLAEPKIMMATFPVMKDKIDEVTVLTELSSIGYMGKNSEFGKKTFDSSNNTQPELRAKLLNGIYQQYSEYPYQTGINLACYIDFYPHGYQNYSQGCVLSLLGNANHTFSGTNPWTTDALHYRGIHNYPFETGYVVDLYLAFGAVEAVLTPMKQTTLSDADLSALTLTKGNYDYNQNCIITVDDQGNKVSNYSWTKNDLQHPLVQTPFTSSTFDPINNEVYSLDKVEKIGGKENPLKWYRPNNYSPIGKQSTWVFGGDMRTKVGDEVFVFMISYQSDMTFTCQTEGWDLVYSGYSGESDYPVSVYSKTATKDYETIYVTNSRPDVVNSNTSIFYISLSNVESYTVSHTSYNQGDRLPTVFIHGRNGRDETENSRVVGNMISKFDYSTINSSYYSYNFIYCGDNVVISKYGHSTLLGLDIVFSNSDQGFQNAYIKNNTYSKVASDATFDAKEIYYVREKAALYNGSEIANKEYVQSSIESLDLDTVSSTEGTYTYVQKCTVTVDSEGNKTPVYTWELET